MIYTLTLNPSLDYHIEVDNFILNNLNVANSNSINSGGKGINVSKVLTNLGTPNTALVLVGGFTGEQILHQLNALNIKYSVVKSQATSRINVKLKDSKTLQETEINGAPIEVTDAERLSIYDLVSKNLKPNDILVCSGSFAKNFPTNVYKKLSLLLPSSVEIVLDTRGPSLLDNLHNNLLIKPNMLELEQALGITITSEFDAIEAAKEFLKKGVKNIIVSLGGKGSLLVNSQSVYRAEPVKVDVVNSVGAGDSMVAGFLSGYSKGLPILDCYKLSIACSLATVTSKEVASEISINKFKNCVKVEKIG